MRRPKLPIFRVVLRYDIATWARYLRHEGDIAVSMRTSPKSEVLAPDIQTPAGGMKATRIAHFRRGNRLDFCVEKSR